MSSTRIQVTATINTTPEPPASQDEPSRLESAIAHTSLRKAVVQLEINLLALELALDVSVTPGQAETDQARMRGLIAERDALAKAAAQLIIDLELAKSRLNP